MLFCTGDLRKMIVVWLGGQSCVYRGQAEKAELDAGMRWPAQGTERLLSGTRGSEMEEREGKLRRRMSTKRL